MVLALLLLGCHRQNCDTSSNRWYDPWYDEVWTQLEIGVGTTSFIEVPYDRHVYPELEPDADGPYINVALQAYDIVYLEDNEVTLEAWVGSTRYAADRYENVDFKCTGSRWYGRAETAGLRMHLDPSTLPAYSPPPPVVREPDEPDVSDEPDITDVFDSGTWREPRVDSGYVWWDSGTYVEQRQGDVRVVATLSHAEVQQEVVYETTWLVYR